MKDEGGWIIYEKCIIELVVIVGYINIYNMYLNVLLLRLYDMV